MPRRTFEINALPLTLYTITDIAFLVVLLIFND